MTRIARIIDEDGYRWGFWKSSTGIELMGDVSPGELVIFLESGDADFDYRDKILRSCGAIGYVQRGTLVDF